MKRLFAIWLGACLLNVALGPTATATDSTIWGGYARKDGMTQQLFDSQDPPHQLNLPYATKTLTGHGTSTVSQSDIFPSISDNGTHVRVGTATATSTAKLTVAGTVLLPGSWTPATHPQHVRFLEYNGWLSLSLGLGTPATSILDDNAGGAWEMLMGANSDPLASSVQFWWYSYLNGAGRVLSLTGSGGMLVGRDFDTLDDPGNGKIRAANQIAVAGGYWIYQTATGTKTATDTGTDTAEMVDFLRGTTVTLSMTNTGTFTATATGTSTFLVVTPRNTSVTMTTWRTNTLTTTDIGTATPSANAIPVADSSNKLHPNWLPVQTYTALGTGATTVSSTGTTIDLGTVTGPAKAGYYKVAYDISGNVGASTNSCKFYVGLSGCGSGTYGIRRTNGVSGAGYYFSVAGTARYQLVSDSACTVHAYMDTENNGLYCVFDAGSLWLERLPE
jgi:hypothetical protein